MLHRQRRHVDGQVLHVSRVRGDVSLEAVDAELERMGPGAEPRAGPWQRRPNRGEALRLSALATARALH